MFPRSKINRRALLAAVNASKGRHWLLDPIFLGVALLNILSLLLIYSSSDRNLSLVYRQAVSIGIGWVLMLTISRISINRIKILIPYLWISLVALLMIVLVAGSVVKGGQRWLSLGVVRFQPSELAKIIVPLMVAYDLRLANQPISWKALGRCAVIIGIPCLLILKQPDLGTSVMVLLAGGGLLLIVGMQRSLWISLMLGLSVLVPTFWWSLYDYQRFRILVLFDPSHDPFGAGYNIIQSKIAVGAGGLWGKGWLSGTQARLKYLPEASTDFIFAVLGEEWGWVGGLVLIALLLVGLHYLINLAVKQEDNFGRLAIAALTLVFFEAFLINAGMVVGVLPVVGVPLPMISLGGSSLLTFMISFGLIISVRNASNGSLAPKNN